MGKAPAFSGGRKPIEDLHFARLGAVAAHAPAAAAAAAAPGNYPISEDFYLTPIRALTST
jgi:hypothetical protein